MVSVTDTVRLSRRLGFGLRPDEEIPADFVGWASGQLETLPATRGIAAANPAGPGKPVAARPAIVAWPDTRSWSIETIIANAGRYLERRDALDKKVAPGTPDHTDADIALRDELTRMPFDVLRRVHQAVYGEAPVLERFTHFWANHFTVGGLFPGELALGHYLEAAIRANLRNDFATMLYDVTTHPSMQNYLDGPFSVGPNSPDGKKIRSRGQFADINENLGRELLELHTLSPAAGYTQDDIVAVAKILTGWGYVVDRERNFPGKDRWRPFFKKNHEPGEKTVMGRTYPSGSDALRLLTDDLAAHEQTVLHLSAKLARSFIAENPSKEDVDAIASVWTQSKGHLPTVHRAVIERAARQLESRIFQQPEVWFYQALRMSGGDVFLGFEQTSVRRRDIDGFLRDQNQLLDELGQHYWLRRQPNGYSDARLDWVSPEQMERRLRFAQMIHRAGNVALQAPELLERAQVGEATRALVDRGKTPEDQFVMLLCSPEMMEA